MSLNKEILSYTEGKYNNLETFFLTSIEKLFQQYPEIAGIILRIGESDGKDVEDHFRSRLLLQTPHQANKFLKKVLPLFEKSDKKLIFRTWTVGIYKIGDLIWNQKTFDTVFTSIASNNLIISMKYGDTDFFRYLPLNPLIFSGKHKKIIEFQTKREWEGMGLYPSFIGWEYEKYIEKLRSNKNIVGIHVWCQTGGWISSQWKTITFLENSSFWNELNTYIVIKLYSKKMSVEEGITNFCKSKGISDTKDFIQLLTYSDIAIKKGLYISEFASRTVYFRRLRIPPQVWITWDKIYITSLTSLILRHTVKDHKRAIEEGFSAVDTISQMLSVGKRIGLDKTLIHSLEFEFATFNILAQIRKMLFGTFSESEKMQLKKQIVAYTLTFPQHYKTEIDVWNQKFKKSKKTALALQLLFRTRKEYRSIDTIVLSTAPIQKYFIKQIVKKVIPSLSSQAMGVDMLFK